MKSINLILAVFIFSIICFTVNAQTTPAKHDSLSQVNIKAKSSNLPEIQRVSVRAPANIKIDGKTTEWDNNFFAKNNYDEIYYTLSNDDDKLYLTVQTLDKFSNRKIIEGGVTLTISHSVEKKQREKDTNNISITFPLAPRATASGVNALSSNYFYFDSKERQQRKKECDSLVNAINERAGKAFKEIKITGIKNVDTLISVYNTTGIKAVVHFDQNMILTYELAIPLKYLGLTTDNPVQFSYDIKINHRPYLRPLGRGGSGTGPGGMVMSGGLGSTPMTTVSGVNPPPDIIYLAEDSDFWGEYTLAKK